VFVNYANNGARIGQWRLTGGIYLAFLAFKLKEMVRGKNT
jgi:hypothetical protein